MTRPASDEPPLPRVGLVRPRGHCTFAWREPEEGGRRSVEVRSTHCEACVAQLEQLGYRLDYVDAEAE